MTCLSRVAFAVWMLGLTTSAPAGESLAAVDEVQQLPGTIYVNGLMRSNDRDEPLGGIFAIDPNTGKCRRVVENGHSTRVSPDGSKLAFGRFEEEGVQSSWVVPVDGSRPPRIIFDRASGALWEPGGGDLLVGQDDDGAWPWVYKHWLISTDGLPPVEVGLFEDEIDDWSSDGEWLVAGSDRHRGEGIGYQLYLKRFDGTDERRLTDGPGLNVYARFNPSATSIVYLRSDKGQSTLRVLDLSIGSKPLDVHRTNDDGTDVPDEACWSPDGRWIAVILFDWHVEEDGSRTIRLDRDQKYRLIVMDREGARRREVSLKDCHAVSLNGLEWR